MPSCQAINCTNTRGKCAKSFFFRFQIQQNRQRSENFVNFGLTTCGMTSWSWKLLFTIVITTLLWKKRDYRIVGFQSKKTSNETRGDSNNLGVTVVNKKERSSTKFNKVVDWKKKKKHRYTIYISCNNIAINKPCSEGIHKFEVSTTLQLSSNHGNWHLRI